MSVINYHNAGGTLLGETNAAGVRRDYLTDALGSIVHTVDQSAVKVNSYRYKPYGGFTIQVSTETAPRFCWTGESGSLLVRGTHSEQYNRARFYGNTAGRWTSVDQLWPDEPAYTYVRGNPVTFVDPSGREAKYPKPIGCKPFASLADVMVKTFCESMEDHGFRQCIVDCMASSFPGFTGGNGVKDCMKSWCQNGSIGCANCPPEPETGRSPCAKTPGLHGGSGCGITLCPGMFNGNCGGDVTSWMGTIAHELGHCCNPIDTSDGATNMTRGGQCNYDFGRCVSTSCKPTGVGRAVGPVIAKIRPF